MFINVKQTLIELYSRCVLYNVNMYIHIDIRCCWSYNSIKKHLVKSVPGEHFPPMGHEVKLKTLWKVLINNHFTKPFLVSFQVTQSLSFFIYLVWLIILTWYNEISVWNVILMPECYLSQRRSDLLLINDLLHKVWLHCKTFNCVAQSFILDTWAIRAKEHYSNFRNT